MYWNCATYILLRYNRENSYNISWSGVVLEKLSTGTQTIFLSNKKTFITFYAAFVSDYFFTFFSTSKWKKYIWDQEMLNWHIKIDRNIYLYICKEFKMIRSKIHLFLSLEWRIWILHFTLLTTQPQILIRIKDWNHNSWTRESQSK